SNWSKPGGESEHNQVYWRGGEWWGIGPGAHSYLANRRWWNIKSPIRYIDAINGGDVVEARDEILTETNRSDERIMLMMRLRDGLRRSDLTVEQVRVIDEYVTSGAIDDAAWQGGRVVLTLTGRLIADRVVRDVVAA
ncbi:MAG: coproporphyrinogen III oxidase, partial [Candidatus Nanopelagicaceae bacterium]